MCLTLDHQILTENGWKNYKSIERKKIGKDGKPIGRNEKIIVYDSKSNTINTEEFIGELYYPTSRKVIYNIKNDYIDTSIVEDHKLLYKFDLSETIKIDKFTKIIYDMTKYNYNILYLFTNSESIIPIEVNKDELIREIKEEEVFSFITSKNTFYVRRNNLEFWTSY
jgi:hypothetical protein